MKKSISLVALAMGLTSSPMFAAELEVTVTNLTNGSYFTPLLVAAHTEGTALFTVGESASVSLQEMAEGGSIGLLVDDLNAASADLIANPAGGLLGPGLSTTANLSTATENVELSVVAMILPTNDGFIGLNGITIPTEPGTYVFDVDAYDSGTEANDEVKGSGARGMPGFPFPGPVGTTSGNNGTGVSTNAEGFVHIHRNVLGDTDFDGGMSDIVSTVQRWLNPVARVTVIVN